MHASSPRDTDFDAAPRSAPAPAGATGVAPALPLGACNAHCHVFGPRTRFPYAAGAPFVPAEDAPREALYALNDALGLSRCVVVQSTCHGTDNAVSLDAVAGRPQDYRAVLLLDPATPDAALRDFDAAGARAVRFNFMGHLGRATPVEEVLALAVRLAPLGWHLQVHGDPRLVLHALAPAWRRSPVPVVIDHIGRLDAGEGRDGADFRALQALMDLPNLWVKVSGIDRVTRQGPPYDDAVELAARLVAQAGDRVLWGNDWPHPNHAGPVPDERQLVERIAAIAPSAASRQALLVDNPQRLYRFGALTATATATATAAR